LTRLNRLLPAAILIAEMTISSPAGAQSLIAIGSSQKVQQLIGGDHTPPSSCMPLWPIGGTDVDWATGMPLLNKTFTDAQVDFHLLHVVDFEPVHHATHEVGL